MYFAKSKPVTYNCRQWTQSTERGRHMCKADCLNNVELGESIMWSEKISSKLFSLLRKKKTNRPYIVRLLTLAYLNPLEKYK